MEIEECNILNVLLNSFMCNQEVWILSSIVDLQNQHEVQPHFSFR